MLCPLSGCRSGYRRRPESSIRGGPDASRPVGKPQQRFRPRGTVVELGRLVPDAGVTNWDRSALNRSQQSEQRGRSNLSVSSVASCSNFLAIIDPQPQSSAGSTRLPWDSVFRGFFAFFFRQNHATWFAKSESVVTGLIRFEFRQSPQSGVSGVSPNFWRNLDFRLPKH